MIRSATHRPVMTANLASLLQFTSLHCKALPIPAELRSGHEHACSLAARMERRAIAFSVLGVKKGKRYLHSDTDTHEFILYRMHSWCVFIATYTYPDILYFQVSRSPSSLHSTTPSTERVLHSAFIKSQAARTKVNRSIESADYRTPSEIRGLSASGDRPAPSRLIYSRASWSLEAAHYARRSHARRPGSSRSRAPVAPGAEAADLTAGPRATGHGQCKLAVPSAMIKQGPYTEQKSVHV